MLQTFELTAQEKTFDSGVGHSLHLCWSPYFNGEPLNESKSKIRQSKNEENFRSHKFQSRTNTSKCSDKILCERRKEGVPRHCTGSLGTVS